jgi:hypothetical protein
MSRKTNGEGSAAVSGFVDLPDGLFTLSAGGEVAEKGVTQVRHEANDQVVRERVQLRGDGSWL